MTSSITRQQSTLLHRAAIARRLIREGKLDPYLGLALVVWPTPGILRREQRRLQRWAA